MMVRFPGGVRH